MRHFEADGLNEVARVRRVDQGIETSNFNRYAHDPVTAGTADSLVPQVLAHEHANPVRYPFVAYVAERVVLRLLSLRLLTHRVLAGFIEFRR